MVGAVADAASGAPLKFVCSTCWLVFDHGGTRACAGCGAASPQLGWPTLPFEFRERYLFVEQLGRGGQGAVFRAYDRQAASQPWVAVKVAKLQGKALDEMFLKEMFRREGRAAAVLSEHPQYFVGFRGSDFNDPAYLVLDFVPWPTLKQMYASEGKLHPLAAARLGVEILRGVRCMERRSMVHRDLKPENIFARRHGDDLFEVKIADLGVWIDAGASDETLLGRADDKRAVGTVGYMSPEQVRSDAVNTASDVHAVASVLWQLTTGAVPFPVKSNANLNDVLLDRLRQCETQPPRPLTMPEELYHILAIALRFNPKDRVFPDPQTMAGRDNPSNGSDARGMEKALQRFVDEYAERRTRALTAAFTKIQHLELQLAKGEKRIATAQTLSTRAQELRARLARLHAESTGFEVVLGVVRAIELEIQDWDASVEAFADAGRSQISEAVKRAEAEAVRAARHEERGAAEALRAAMLEATAKANAARADQAEARAAIEARRAERAEEHLRPVRKRRNTQWLFRVCFALAGSCVGFGVASALVHPAPSTPSPQQAVVAAGSADAKPLPSVAQPASPIASATPAASGEPTAPPTPSDVPNPPESAVLAPGASASTNPATSAAPDAQRSAQQQTAEPDAAVGPKPSAGTIPARVAGDTDGVYGSDTPKSSGATKSSAGTTPVRAVGNADGVYGSDTPKSSGATKPSATATSRSKIVKPKD